MSLILVVIPWLSYLYLSEMEDFLVDSQANAQLLTAEGISTLLNGRPDLFYDLPLTPEGYEAIARASFLDFHFMKLCAMHAKARAVPQRASPRTWKRPRPCCFSWPFTGSTV